MKNTLFFLALFTSVIGSAQVYPQIGARSAALGGTGLTFNDVYSIYNNPGAFGALEKTAIGLNYENRFLLKELSSQALAFGYHTEKSGNFGVQFQQQGFSLYREMQASLVYGRQLFNKFYGGFAVNFHRIQLGDIYGSKNTASATLGIFYEATDALNFGVRIQNISRTQLSEFEDERLPTRFAIGATYTFSEKVLWNVEAEKTIIHPLNVKSGIEIHPHEILYLRLGVNSYPFQSAFGFGLAFKNLQFDMSTMWHSNLGLSPSAGLKYRFN
ncbi:MAG: hypothetical protein ACI8ZM_005052 [Crocinitomix sp.]|jgi:hypothetical protein